MSLIPIPPYPEYSGKPFKDDISIEPIELETLEPGEIIMGEPPSPKLIFPDEAVFKDEVQVDGMDLKEVIDFLLEEIDLLNKRIKSLETKRS